MAIPTRKPKRVYLTEDQIRKSKFEAAMLVIRKEEPAMAQAIEEAAIHIGETFGDKYANSPIETKGLIYWKDDKAKGYNIGQAVRYCQRYLTDGFKKSDNPTDIKKGLHYLFFELTRLILIGKTKSNSKDIIE